MTIAWGPAETRVLVCQGPEEVLRAVLGRRQKPDRVAMTRLLEALALWFRQTLRVVLYVEPGVDASSSALDEGLGIGARDFLFEVEILDWRADRRRRRRMRLGDFAELRRIAGLR